MTPDVPPPQPKIWSLIFMLAGLLGAIIIVAWAAI